MSTDWFSKLKEYDSLLKMSLKADSETLEQQERINKLSSFKNERLELINSLQSRYSELSQIYLEKEKELNTSESQAKNLQDMGGDEQKIQTFLDRAHVLENEIMDILDSQESIQNEIKDHKTFLTGLEKTMVEISQEVNSSIENFSKESQQYRMRMNLLFEELPDQFKNALNRVLAKKLAHGPFTKNENGSCYFCRFKISKIDESEIDVQKLLKHCPQCSRIFLPYN